MNQVLEDSKDSVSKDVHIALLSKMQMVNDKSMNLGFKEADLRLKIDKL